METKESIAQYLNGLAGDILSGKPIRTALDDLEDALDDWEDEFPEE